VGDRETQQLTADAGATVDELLDAIVSRYLKIDCAMFTPNESRVEHVLSMVKALRADGVIHYGLMFCSPYRSRPSRSSGGWRRKACQRCASTQTTARRISGSSRLESKPSSNG
jgi:benzoyl-CoA reductase/2-hydroxyglutaryl-CoA dehydratase subunit BcrC/BadD/HgdB